MTKPNLASFFDLYSSIYFNKLWIPAFAVMTRKAN
jgi:hypothetical protein